jgi:hypothetical protein
MELAVNLGDKIMDKDVNDELMNWGRAMHNGWIKEHLLVTPPPIFNHYQAPIVAYDDPEPALMPVDELAALRTEALVVQLGTTHFDSFRVLIYWYTRLMQMRSDHLNHDERIKRLSKHMRCSFSAAERMQKEAVIRFSNLRFTKV